jgi:TolB protein
MESNGKMNKRLLVIPIFLFFLLMGISHLGQAVEIDISGEKRVEKKYIITLIPFYPQKNPPQHPQLAEKMDKVLKDDLVFSNFFQIAKSSHLIDEISALDRKIGKIHFWRWQETGSRFLMIPKYNIEGKNLSVNIEAYEIISGNLFFSMEYKGTVADLRKIIHRCSDEVLFRFTGERGPFETRIAYISSYRGIKEIFICDYDGKNSKAITNYGSISIFPAWAPIDPILAYTSYLQNNADLFVKSLTTSQEKPLAQYPGLNTAPDWSPDGAYIACSLSHDGNSEIYTIRLNDKKIKRLSYHRAIDTSPTWDSESRNLAFCSDRSGSPQIYIMSSEGKNVRRISFLSGYNAAPDWSPKGDKIAYASRINGAFQIVIYDVRKKREFQLTNEVTNCENPSWSPDSRYLAFDSNLTGKKQLYIINANGKNKTAIKFGSIETSDPAWSPIYKQY